MRAPVRTLLLALLLAAINGSDIEPQLFERGHFVELTVATLTSTASKCYLVTPSNIEIDLLASEILPDKYEYLPNTLSSCRVRINDLDENDKGLWSLHAVIPSESDTVVELKEQVYVAIRGNEESKETVTSEETTSGENSASSADHIATSEESSDEDIKASSENSQVTSGESLEETTSGENSAPSAENNATSEESSDEDIKASSENSQVTSGESVEETTSGENSAPSAENIATSEESSDEDIKASSENSQVTSGESLEETTSGENLTPSAENIATSEESSDEDIKASSENSQVTSGESLEETTSGENSAPSAENNATSEESSDEDIKASSENSQVTSGESLEVSSSEEEEVIEIQWLSDLRFVTRTGLNVDINLPKTLNSETCTLTKPDGTTVDVGDGIAGVTAHSSSDYVSCRVVVGPMDESLLGNWTLCGSYEDNDVKHRRCQNAEIVWRNTANPGSVWETTINPRFNHVVHFGSTMTPTVRGTGSVVSCHIVTPDDEDLFVTRDREYPDVQLIQNTDSACSIAIGPIADSHLGDWDVYGTFDSALWGYNEVRNPINMELYDMDNPYDQAYNVTTVNPTQHVVNLGSTISVETTSTGQVDVCQFTMPSGQTYLSTGALPTGVSFVTDHRVACRLSVGPITDNMLGGWLLIGKFSNRGVHTENRLTFTIIQEDPSNPIEEDRTILYLDEQLLDTSIGASHRVTIASDIFSTAQSCHIRTPDGLQYTIMEGFHIPGVEVVTGSNIFCGVTLEVSEDLIGAWTLISREIRSSQPNERRLPFIIYVEESVEAVPNEITITEGNTVHVHLANPTELYDTCELKGPDGEQITATLDSTFKETCGFVAPSVDAGHNGTWNIVYGTKIIYKAPILVNVNAREDAEIVHLNWVEHTSVNQTIGPEEAVYCRVQSPVGVVVFDGFGRCQVIVNSVMRDQHQGDWSMVVGLPGRIVTEKHMLNVKVKAPDAKLEVDTKVVDSQGAVELTCSVTSSQQKTGCLFRSPAGDVLVATQGVSESRYVFHVNQNSIEYYSCRLQITETIASDLGIWRCDIESEEENYYGFLTIGSWALMDPILDGSFVAEPELVAQAASVSVVEYEPVTLACSARAPLRYCYFRASNGTIFNVSPGMSSPTVEYVGAGLDAGECGARFQNMLYTDAGQWSCHAGIDGKEQFHRILVSVQEEVSVWSGLSGPGLSIQVRVPQNRQIEYCRFVRFDGFGFSSDSMPFPYNLDMKTSSSVGISVVFSALDLLPWTVVTKLVDRDGEISRVTGGDWPGPPEMGSYYNALFMWLPLLLIMIGCLILAGVFAPAKNRRWAAERASGLRSSMRDSMRASVHRFSSFRKKPIDTNPAA